MNKNFYITTSIFYASAKPHIGNTYEGVLTDAIARYKRLTGYNVIFQTGTDEHGEKVEQNAIKVGLEPQKYVDEISLEVRRILDLLNVSYDKFVRTTNPNHKEVVQKIFQKLYDQGDIYKAKYEGLYCTPCESFLKEGQLIDGKCPDCKRDVINSSEDAYFLKLSKYNKWLEEYINDNPGFIEPESRKNEIVNNFIKPGVSDLCITRSSFKWGVEVPFDKKHISYVWIDALANYISFLGYEPFYGSSEEFERFWPADIHVIGKDILRFHTIYWPVLLKALGLKQPKKIFGHPWVLVDDGDKMSKSKGNVMYADELISYYGVDAVRYYLLHEIPFSHDGYISHSLLIDRINSDLANTMGNLVNRTISMAYKYLDGKVFTPTEITEEDVELINLAKDLKGKVENKMNNLRIQEAIDAIFELYRRSNKYIDETTPWILAKDEKKLERLKTILYNLLESIRTATVFLQAFLPETADKIFNQLNTANRGIDSVGNFDGLDSGIKLNEPEVLFARIDKEKKLKEIKEQN